MVGLRSLNENHRAVSNLAKLALSATTKLLQDERTEKKREVGLLFSRFFALARRKTRRETHDGPPYISLSLSSVRIAAELSE